MAFRTKEYELHHPGGRVERDRERQFPATVSVHSGTDRDGLRSASVCIRMRSPGGGERVCGSGRGHSVRDAVAMALEDLAGAVAHPYRGG